MPTCSPLFVYQGGDQQTPTYQFELEHVSQHPLLLANNQIVLPVCMSSTPQWQKWQECSSCMQGKG